MSMTESVIELSGLGKAYTIYKQPQDRLKQMLWRRWRRFYEEYWAIHDISLTIGRGETVGIIGRNGSGKSTLLQLIAGTVPVKSAWRSSSTAKVTGLR